MSVNRVLMSLPRRLARRLGRWSRLLWHQLSPWRDLFVETAQCLLLFLVLFLLLEGFLLMGLFWWFPSAWEDLVEWWHLTTLVDYARLPHPQITIHVLAFSRFLSLKRTLRSLVDADYMQLRNPDHGQSFQVPLEVWVDHAPPAQSGDYPFMTRMETAQDDYHDDNDQLDHVTDNDWMLNVDVASVYGERTRRLSQSHAILHYLTHDFHWPHGPIKIHYRQKNVGLLAQWLESWMPSKWVTMADGERRLNEFVYVVEDDIVVSPMWYRFMVRAVQTYYFDDMYRDDRIYGVSTQIQRFALGKTEKGFFIPGTPHTDGQAYLYTMVGTWGQLLFPHTWLEFRMWLDHAIENPTRDAFVGGQGPSIMLTSLWHRERGNNGTIWTPWFFKFLAKKRYFNVYASQANGTALSISYQEMGGSYKARSGPNSKLARTADEVKYSFMPASHMTRFTQCMNWLEPGQILKWDESDRDPGVQAKSWRKLIRFLGQYTYLPKLSILVTGIDDVSEWPVARNWLCRMELIGIESFVFLTEDALVAEEVRKLGYGAVLMVKREENELSAHTSRKWRTAMEQERADWFLEDENGELVHNNSTDPDLDYDVNYLLHRHLTDTDGVEHAFATHLPHKNPFLDPLINIDSYTRVGKNRARLLTLRHSKDLKEWQRRRQRRRARVRDTLIEAALSIEHHVVSTSIRTVWRQNAIQHLIKRELKRNETEYPNFRPFALHVQQPPSSPLPDGDAYFDLYDFALIHPFDGMLEKWKQLRARLSSSDDKDLSVTVLSEYIRTFNHDERHIHYLDPVDFPRSSGDHPIVDPEDGSVQVQVILPNENCCFSVNTNTNVLQYTGHLQMQSIIKRQELEIHYWDVMCRRIACSSWLVRHQLSGELRQLRELAQK